MINNFKIMTSNPTFKFASNTDDDYIIGTFET